MRHITKAIFLPLLAVILAFFCGSVFASTETIYQVVKDSFPRPYFAPTDGRYVADKVLTPVLFRSGHGYYESSNAGAVKSSDTDDPAISQSSKEI